MINSRQLLIKRIKRQTMKRKQKNRLRYVICCYLPHFSCMRYFFFKNDVKHVSDRFEREIYVAFKFNLSIFRIIHFVVIKKLERDRALKMYFPFKKWRIVSINTDRRCLSNQAINERNQYCKNWQKKMFCFLFRKRRRTRLTQRRRKRRKRKWKWWKWRSK